MMDWLCRPLYGDDTPFDVDGPKRGVVVPLLFGMLDHLDINPRKVKHLISSVGGSLVSVKEIKTLRLDPEELDSALFMEARKHLPLDGSESIIDYQILGDDPDELNRIKVLMVATTRRHFENHMNLLKEVGLRPGMVDVDPLGIANSFIVNTEPPDEGVLVFLNIGTMKTNLVILGRKDLFFARDIGVGGYHFTQEISKRLNISYPEAEKLKVSSSGNPDTEELKGGGGEALRVAERSSQDSLAAEVNRSLRYYVKETGQSHIQRIYLTGGSAVIGGLDSFFEDKFNIPVEIYNPTDQLDLGCEEPDHPAQLALAVGLALRGD